MSELKAAGYIIFIEDSFIVGWGQTMDEAMNSIDAEEGYSDLQSCAASALLLSEIAECGPDNVCWLTCDIASGPLAINEYEQEGWKDEEI